MLWIFLPGIEGGTAVIHIAQKASDGLCAFATWFHNVGELSVNVMFAVEGEKRNGLVGAWHPKFGTNKLIIADFG